MGKKKQFINKKTAQHFHVVHRSQRDPKANDPDASKYVLLSSKKQIEIEFRSDSENDDDDDEFDSDDDEMPDLISSPSNVASASVKKSSKAKAPPAASSKSAFPVRKVRFGNIVAEDLVDENGIVRDGYDYTQHLKEMGKGKFYSADGQFSSQSELARRVELPEDVLPSGEEQDRLLDAITLTTDLMDEDLREALINDEAFEEIDDDFMAQAAVVDPEESAADGFDYDAHIVKLMEAASGVPKFRGDLSGDEDDDDEFDEDDDEEFSDEEDYEIDEADKAEEQRVLDALFEKTLAEEYDDEQLGELEEDDPETRGKLVLEGDLLDSIVEDFVTVRLEMLNDEGKIGNPLRTGNHLKEILEECEKEREEAEALAEAEGGDTMPEDDDVDLEAELKALYTRNAYLTAREEETWDCETIVSTYSNLDNHPTILREENVSKRKKKRSAVANMDTEALLAMANGGNGINSKSTIVLSKKTGMPLGVFETAKKETRESREAEAAALLSKREKSETKEEKKARKEAVKALKSQRRQEKKQWKTAFKDEEQRQLGLTPGGKVSIFKY